MLDLRKIHEKCKKALCNPKERLELSESDALALWHAWRQCKRDLLELSEKHEEPSTRCKMCGGRTWGRPTNPSTQMQDFAKRRCSTCGEVRDEPTQ